MRICLCSSSLRSINDIVSGMAIEYGDGVAYLHQEKKKKTCASSTNNLLAQRHHRSSASYETRAEYQ